MLISMVAKATGLPKDTIRYYTKLGLVKAEDMDAGSRVYANYDDSVVELLSEIKLAKSAGFTLSEIRLSMTEWNDGKLSSTEVLQILTKKLVEVNRKKQELTEVENILKVKIKQYNQDSSS